VPSHRRDRCAWAVPVVLAMSGGWVGCGSDEAIGAPAGRAEVLSDGRIVLTDCPSPEPIDTHATYALSTPTGSCQPDTTCEVRTQQWCQGDIQGPIFDWRCTCSGGAWSCQVTSKGMQFCPTLPNQPPAGDSFSCAYDLARGPAIECRGDVEECGLTSIQQCPGGGQGRTSRWLCRCQGFPLIAPRTLVWSCSREGGGNESCPTNSCPLITSYSVNATRPSIGERVELRASVRDDDADDMTVRWTTTRGRLVSPYTRNTSYICSELGTTKLTFVASDSKCESSIDVTIECTE
jgi:hypothetical protein